MPRCQAAEQQPPAAGIEAVARSRASGHACLQRQKPGRAGRGLYSDRRRAMSAADRALAARIARRAWCIDGSRMRPDPAQSAVCGAHEPARRRAEAGEAATAACSAATDAAARRRSAVPSADRRDRPPRAAEAARRRARTPSSPSRSPSTATARRRRNRPRAPYQIYASDETGDLVLTYLQRRAGTIWRSCLPVGERRYVSGTAALYDGMLQMVHPDRVVDEAELRQAAADRAGLSADRRARRSTRCARRSTRALAQPAGAAGMAGRELARARALSRLSPRRCARCTGRPSPPTSLPEGAGLVAARL